LAEGRCQNNTDNLFHRRTSGRGQEVDSTTRADIENITSEEAREALAGNIEEIRAKQEALMTATWLSVLWNRRARTRSTDDLNEGDDVVRNAEVVDERTSAGNEVAGNGAPTSPLVLYETRRYQALSSRGKPPENMETVSTGAEQLDEATPDEEPPREEGSGRRARRRACDR